MELNQEDFSASSSSNSSNAQQDKINSKTKITEENLSPKTIKGFEYKCICDWSKDDKFGFIPNTKCPVHGKETRKRLSKTVPIKLNSQTKPKTK